MSALTKTEEFLIQRHNDVNELTSFNRFKGKESSKMSSFFSQHSISHKQTKELEMLETCQGLAERAEDLKLSPKQLKALRHNALLLKTDLINDAGNDRQLVRNVKETCQVVVGIANGILKPYEKPQQIIEKGMVFLLKHCEAKGIFRVSGSKDAEEEIREQILDDPDYVIPADAQVDAVSSAVKRAARELCEDQHWTFNVRELQDYAALKDDVQRICFIKDKLQEKLKGADIDDVDALRKYFLLLQEVGRHSSENKMPVSNLASMAGPGIAGNLQAAPALVFVANQIAEVMINHIDEIIGQELIDNIPLVKEENKKQKAVINELRDLYQKAAAIRVKKAQLSLDMSRVSGALQSAEGKGLFKQQERLETELEKLAQQFNDLLRANPVIEALYEGEIENIQRLQQSGMHPELYGMNPESLALNNLAQRF